MDTLLFALIGYISLSEDYDKKTTDLFTRFLLFNDKIYVALFFLYSYTLTKRWYGFSDEEFSNIKNWFRNKIHVK